MFINLSMCAFVHRRTAQPPAELCDPIKGRSGVSTLSSSPRAKLRSAELEGGHVLDWKLAAAPFLTPFLLFSLLSLSHSQYQPLSIPVQPFSLPIPRILLHLPPPVSHTAAIVPRALQLHGS